MQRKLFIGLCLILLLSSPAWAQLGTVGIPVDPHGFPLSYGDGAIQLELCLDATGACVFDPVIAGNAWSATSGFGAEAFYWLADAQVRPLVAGGKAILVMGLEAAYGGTGDAVDGNQISFARIRVRVDVAQPGNYRITHPYGVLDFPNVTVADGINYTEDIGGIDPSNPAAAFEGALGGKIGPFLTWTDYATDPALVIADPNNLAPDFQYVGLPGTPHTVTGSPTGANLFRIEIENSLSPGTYTILDETDLFSVAGKVLSPTTPAVAHVFPVPVPPNLFAVGPVNRAAAFPAAGSSDPHPDLEAAAVPEFPLDPAAPIIYPGGTGYPIGFPYWYQERVTVADPLNPGAFIDQGGLKLTICPGSDPMCISMPVDPANPQSALLDVGDESFWWAADSIIDADTPGNTSGVDGILVMGLEGAFGGTGVVNEGDQMAFARIRIRIDTPVAGDYTITHPYGQITFTDVPADRRAINYTEDLGNINIATPDIAFPGALYGKIGPRFLTWDTFNPALPPGDPAIDLDLLPGSGILYVGNPAIPHAVIGSPIPDATHLSGFSNYFRIQGPGGIDVQTDLFIVQGKVYDPLTFVPAPPNANFLAANDIATVDGDVATPINVLANDTFIDPAVSLPIVVEVLPQATFGPFDGQVVVNADNTVTYTPTAGFAGIDSFTYRFLDSGVLASNTATVSITVDNLTLDRAQLDLRRLTWNIRGTGTPGVTLTLHEGPDLTGAVIGSVLVDAAGGWQFRGRALTAPAVTSISIVSSTGKQLLNQPLRIR